MRPDDETLMAYADDALAPAERAEIDELLKTDDEARRVVEEFKAGARLARLAYADIVSETAPDRLIQAAMGASPTASNVVRFADRRRGSLFNQRGFTLSALAACLTLILGAGGGAWLAQRQTPAGAQLALGSVEPGSTIGDVLETQPSGADVALTDGAEPRRLSVLATFRDGANRVCREVELFKSGVEPIPVAAGVACRNPQSATWAMVGAVQIAGFETDSGGSYRPSGAAESDALKGLLNALGAKSALSPDAERALLERKWR